jgi:hypothetical protein
MESGARQREQEQDGVLIIVQNVKLIIYGTAVQKVSAKEQAASGVGVGVLMIVRHAMLIDFGIVIVKTLVKAQEVNGAVLLEVILPLMPILLVVGVLMTVQNVRLVILGIVILKIHVKK